MIADRLADDPETRNAAFPPYMDRIGIRELLENWVLWRDAGDWDRFQTLWAPEGRMNATWFRASAAEFTAQCRKVFEAGMVGQHFLGGSSIQVQGRRATTQTKMQIVQRARVHGVAVDVICQGRFFDALRRLDDDRWGIVLRQPVYELDRMAVLDPTAALTLDPELLASFPEGYRHLAYLQTQLGFEVRKDLPGTRGPEIEALGGRMNRWLNGANDECLGG